MVHSPVSFKTDKLHLLLPLRETPEDLADNLDGGVRTAIINEYDLQIAVCLPENAPGALEDVLFGFVHRYYHADFMLHVDKV